MVVGAVVMGLVLVGVTCRGVTCRGVTLLLVVMMVMVLMEVVVLIDTGVGRGNLDSCSKSTINLQFGVTKSIRLQSKIFTIFEYHWGRAGVELLVLLFIMVTNNPSHPCNVLV